MSESSDTARAYLPIEDYALIGDLHTVALVGKNGSIDWCCLPRFDDPSVFGALLDTGKGGFFRIALADPSGVKNQQLYLPETNLLLTRFLSPDGVGEITDFMPIKPVGTDKHEHHLIRSVAVHRGSLSFTLTCRPAFNYARDLHQVTLSQEGALFQSQHFHLGLASPLALEIDGQGGVQATFTLHKGQSAHFVLESTQAIGYTWLRDASFSLYSLLTLGFTQEAQAFMGWLDARCHDLKDGGTLQPMYGIDGEQQLTEISLDPPGHRQVRALISKAFTPRRVAQLEGRITSLVHTLLETGASKREMDIVDDLALPLPSRVMADLLGCPPADADRFQQWLAAVMGPDLARRQEAFARMHSYFRTLIAQRGQEPHEDLVSALLQAEADGERLSEGDVLGTCALLLLAGNETATSLIGNAILCFDEHPAAWQQLLVFERATRILFTISWCLIPAMKQVE